MDRRHFLGSILAAGAGTRSVGVGVEASSSRTVCAFVKFLQSLSFDEWARTMAESGFSGIEATVRKGGQIAPERVEDALPALVKALERHGCELTLMATDVNRADDAVMERTLRMAASLGVRRYRMGYYHDDLEGYLRAS